MNRNIALLIAFVGLFAIFLVQFLVRGALGFPTTHPADADCIGYKKLFTDNAGIERVSCYGIIYNYWLE